MSKMSGSTEGFGLSYVVANVVFEGEVGEGFLHGVGTHRHS